MSLVLASYHHCHYLYDDYAEIVNIVTIMSTCFFPALQSAHGAQQATRKRPNFLNPSTLKNRSELTPSPSDSFLLSVLTVPGRRIAFKTKQLYFSLSTLRTNITTPTGTPAYCSAGGHGLRGIIFSSKLSEPKVQMQVAKGRYKQHGMQRTRQQQTSELSVLSAKVSEESLSRRVS